MTTPWRPFYQWKRLMEVSDQLHAPGFLSSEKFQVSCQQTALSSQIENGQNREGKGRVKVVIPQNLTPCSSIDIYRCFGGKRSLHLHSCSLNKGWGRFSEMSVNLSYTTRRHIPADVIFTVTAIKTSNLVEKRTTLPEIEPTIRRLPTPLSLR